MRKLKNAIFIQQRPTVGNVVSGQFGNLTMNMEMATVRRHIPARYTDLRFCGSGGQGAVMKAHDLETDRDVAIKRLSNATTRHAYREFVLLSSIDHPNIIKLLDAFTPQSTLEEFTDVYFVVEYLPRSLHELGIRLDVQKISFLMYQLLCGINHLHRAGIIHRDLKPENIMVNGRCELKIIDLGWSRYECNEQNSVLTTTVMTTEYRAPEVILKLPNYNNKVDLWSAGCIFAELLLGRRIFPGINNLNQWTQIVNVLGTPSQTFISNVPDRLRAMVQNQECLRPATPWETIIPDSIFPASEDDPRFRGNNLRDLLSQLLVIDPEHRLSAAAALEHSFVSMWRQPEEVDAPMPQHFEDVERDDSVSRALLFDRLRSYMQNRVATH